MRVDLGAQTISKFAVAPAQFVGTTAQGAASIDRKGYESGVIVLTSGAASGAPSSFALTAALQHCATSDGEFAAATDVAGNAITVAVTAVNTTSEVGFRAVHLKRYLRVVVTPAIVGGTNPAILGSAVLVLGEAKNEPAGDAGALV